MRVRVTSPDGVCYEVNPTPEGAGVGRIGRILLVDVSGQRIACPMVRFVQAEDVVYYEAPAGPDWHAPPEWARVAPSHYWLLTASDRQFLTSLKILPED
jgi:hypothetical protein